MALALESPIKDGSGPDHLRFQSPPRTSVMYRGPVEVRWIDGTDGKPRGRHLVHLVLRQGQEGPRLGQVTLQPGEQRLVRVRLIYPADATPPQVLTLLPMKQSTPLVSDSP